jgi:hypothetical protein
LFIFEPNGLDIFGFPIPAIHSVFFVLSFKFIYVEKKQIRLIQQIVNNNQKKDAVPVGSLSRFLGNQLRVSDHLF